MVSETYQWIFSGIGSAVVVGLIGFGYRQWRGRKREDQAPSSTLTVQGGKVENSPVASGSGIVQTINSPTTTVHYSTPAPTVERGCDFWLRFHPTGSRALMIQSSGAEPAFDVVVRIPADGSGFNSDMIHRLPNDGEWVACSLNGNFVYIEAMRKILAEVVLHGTDNGHEVKAIPVLITYRTRQEQGTFELEIRLPLRDGIVFALPKKGQAANTSRNELETNLAQARLEEMNAQRRRREAQERHEDNMRLLTAPNSGIRAFARQEMSKAQAGMGAGMLIPFTVEQLVSELGAPQSDIEEALQTLSYRGQAKRTSLPGHWVIYDS